MKTLLVVVAHPDDETLMAGGTIARHAEAGWDIVVCIACENWVRNDLTEAQAKAQVGCALSILSAEWEVRYLNFSDQSLSGRSIAEIAGEVKGLIGLDQPEKIITHAWDLNHDHQIVHDAVMVASNLHACQVLAGYVPSASGLAGHPTFRPTYFTRLQTRHLKLKLQAFEQYTNEIQAPPLPRSLENIETVAKYFGGVIGVHMAEAFEVIKDIQ